MDNYNNQPELKVIDLSTGEINNEYVIVHKLKEGDTANDYTVVHNKTQQQRRDYFKNRGERDRVKNGFRELGHFIWHLSEGDGSTFIDLKPQSITRLIYLATFANYDGVLVDNKDNAYTIAQIVYLLELSYNKGREFITEIQDRGYINIDLNDKVQLNSSYFQRGALSNITDYKKNGIIVTRLFNEAIRNIYTNVDTKSHRYLGYLFKLIPYINTKYNILCKDNIEQDRDNLERMTLGDVCAVLNHDKSNARRLGNELLSLKLKDGSAIFAAVAFKSLDVKNMCLIINPKVLFGGHLSDFINANNLFLESKK